MDSAEIREILNKHCREVFGGVFSANDFVIPKNPSFLVLNTHESGLPGQHWVCLYVNETRSEFFDSMALAPWQYHEYWHSTLLELSPSYCYNTERLQAPGSNVCGEYCIAYVILRSRGFSFESVLKMLQKINLKNFVSKLALFLS